MGRILRFRRGFRFWCSALARRLLLVALLVTGLDLVHDGRVGWPAMLAPGLASAPAAREAPTAREADKRAIQADLSGRVERVIDGDSLRIRISGLGPVEVRLHGVDTPEYDQPYGSAAERELRRLVARQRVDLVSETVDSYGRLVATVYRGDLNVNRELVRRGYAWWYRRYARFDFALRRAEKEARAQRLGLWRDDDPMPPWDWRRK